MKYEHTKPYEDFFWNKNNIKLLNKRVSQIDDAEKIVITSDGQKLPFDKLVIATGSVTTMYDWPGQDLKGVCGLYSLQDLEKIEAQTKHIKSAVIVGGGLIGIELTEMLHTRHIAVTLLIKDSHYWGNTLPRQDAMLIEKQILKNGVKMHHHTELREIKGNDEGVKSVVTKDGLEITCEFVGITAGVSPNISLLKGSNIKTGRGVLINEYFETNCKDIYAIGDCAEFENPLKGRKPVEQVWYTGKMHGETLGLTLAGKRTKYQPGPWFNSAKFFNLEYQTYGIVPAKKEEGNEYFFWQHPEKDIALGVYYNQINNSFLGCNSYGIRLRHEFFDRCLAAGATAEYVITNLNDAWFNREFTKNYVSDIKKAWYQSSISNSKQLV